MKGQGMHCSFEWKHNADLFLLDSKLLYLYFVHTKCELHNAPKSKKVPFRGSHTFCFKGQNCTPPTHVYHLARLLCQRGAILMPHFTVPDLLKSMSSHEAESGESNQSLSRPHVNKSYLKFTDATGKETDLTHEIQLGNLTCPCNVGHPQVSTSH